MCRIADLGKFKFESDKRARDAKKNQHVSEVKEVRIRPRTDDHDLQVRVRAARRFLEEGHKVKVEVRFRGREATHPEVARDQIGRIAAGVADIAIVERPPSMEGRAMFAILARGRAQQAQAAQGAQTQAANRPNGDASRPPRPAQAPASAPAAAAAAVAPTATATPAPSAPAASPAPAATTTTQPAPAAAPAPPPVPAISTQPAPAPAASTNAQSVPAAPTPPRTPTPPTPPPAANAPAAPAKTD